MASGRDKAPSVAVALLVPRWRNLLRRVLALWLGDRAESASRWCLVLACGLLVFDSAGTLQLGYTVTISYALALLACAIGALQVARRWRELPAVVRYVAPGLWALYAVATLIGHPETLAASTRGGASREYVYLLDLGLGLMTLALIPTVFARRSPHPLMIAIAVAGGLAGAYAVYQWFAKRYGLPLSDINNTLDSNGLTFGESQGIGLFGGQRVRGTFLEPHFLAGFLATALPLQLWAIRHARGRLRAVAVIGAVAGLGGLLLSDSAPGWGGLVLALSAGGLLYAINTGRTAWAAAGGAVTCGLLLAVAPVLIDPALLTAITGRSSTDLQLTTVFRTQIWSTAVNIWSHRPLLGYGPGQSSVRLAYALVAPARPQVLQSAQGIWAASMIDAGVLGLAAWIYILGGTLLRGAVGVTRKTSAGRAAIYAAAVAAVYDALISGDRLYPKHWLILGLLLAAASHTAEAPDV